MKNHEEYKIKQKAMKIDRLADGGIGNVSMKFEIEIPKQTEAVLQKPCCLEMDR